MDTFKEMIKKSFYLDPKPSLTERIVSSCYADTYTKQKIADWVYHGEIKGINITREHDGTTNYSIDLSTSFEEGTKMLDKLTKTDPAWLRNYKARNSIKDVKFNGPATIVWFYDTPFHPDDAHTTKVVVKCQPGDEYDKEKGLLAAIAKYYMGGPVYNDVLKKWCTDED